MTTRPTLINIHDVSKHSFDTIIDVRSPAEFADDHIPGAINCPVLSDDERIEIGTIYKQVSPFEARKKGAVLVARNIARHIEGQFLGRDKQWRPLVYCWRGGQRSGAMQVILREIGWDACRIDGGYKAYRTQIMQQIEEMPGRFRYIVVHGPTGSGKTKLLGCLERLGSQVLDLEQMANHKGSVLGRNPDHSGQSRKAFDTALIEKLSRFDSARPVFVEAESKKIGIIHLPPALYTAMYSGQAVCLAPDINARIEFLIEDYAALIAQPEEMKARLSALKFLRGKDVIERWIGMVDAEQWHPLVKDLLEQHYDPLYAKSGARGVGDAVSLERIDEGHLMGLAEEMKNRFDR